MKKVTRTGITLNHELMAEFDTLIKHKGYKNRSQAINDLIRQFIEHGHHPKENSIIGTIRLLYNHKLNKQVTDIQHDYPCLVISSMNVHVDHNTSLALFVVKGEEERVKKLAEKIINSPGVVEGKLVVEKE